MREICLDTYYVVETMKALKDAVIPDDDIIVQSSLVLLQIAMLRLSDPKFVRQTKMTDTELYARFMQGPNVIFRF